MAEGSSEASRLSVPPPPPPPVRRCLGPLQAAGNNGTCAEQLGLFPPFSSTLALLVLVSVLAGIVLVSLATFHFHKRKLRNRKIQRAQEEYERDSRSPARAGEHARPCVIVRPVRCDAEREEKLEEPCPSVGSVEEGGGAPEEAAGAEEEEEEPVRVDF